MEYDNAKLRQNLAEKWQFARANQKAERDLRVSDIGVEITGFIVDLHPQLKARPGLVNRDTCEASAYLWGWSSVSLESHSLKTSSFRRPRASA